MPFRSKLLAIALVLAVAFAAFPARVSADDDDALTSQQILQNASKKLAETPTIRFELKIDGDTFIDNDQTMRLLEAKGILVRPDRVQTEFKLKVLGTVTISTSLIIVGSERWSTDLITGSWGPAPEEFGYDPGILFDNQQGIGPVMDRVQNATRLENEKIDDKDCFHLQAELDPAIIEELSSGNLTGSPVTADLWIDRETFDVLRVRLAEPDTVKDRDPATWTLDFSDQGKDLKVEPPE
jgi:hypothetical protein